MTQTEIAAAVAKMQARRPTDRGVYQVAGGWMHSKSGAAFAEREGADTDYRFCREWEGR